MNPRTPPAARKLALLAELAKLGTVKLRTFAPDHESMHASVYDEKDYLIGETSFWVAGPYVNEPAPFAGSGLPVLRLLVRMFPAAGFQDLLKRALEDSRVFYEPAEGLLAEGWYVSRDNKPNAGPYRYLAERVARGKVAP